MKKYINHIFAVASPELPAYLAKFAVGKDLGAEWKVVEVKQIDVPPHPQTGEACTQVVIAIEKPGEDPLDIPPPTQEVTPASPSPLHLSGK